MTKEEVIKLMESSKTQEEWNNNCDLVKGRFEGYPEYWFKEIIQSGLAGRVLASFGQDDNIHIEPIRLPQPYKQITEMPKITAEVQEHRVIDKSLTSAICLSLKQFDNTELAVFNLVMHTQGKLIPQHLCYNKALELDLINNNGTSKEPEELKRALVHEVMRRKEAGTFN